MNHILWLLWRELRGAITYNRNLTSSGSQGALGTPCLWTKKHFGFLSCDISSFINMEKWSLGS